MTAWMGFHPESVFYTLPATTAGVFWGGPIGDLTPLLVCSHRDRPAGFAAESRRTTSFRGNKVATEMPLRPVSGRTGSWKKKTLPDRNSLAGHVLEKVWM